LREGSPPKAQARPVLRLPPELCLGAGDGEGEGVGEAAGGGAFEDVGAGGGGVLDGCTEEEMERTLQRVATERFTRGSGREI